MAAQAKPLTGFVKRRERGWKALITHHNFRRLVQIGFALFIIFITVQHVVIGEDSGIITASPEAFCPLGGLETSFKYLTMGGSFVSHTHQSNLVVFIAMTLGVLLLRASFCGWVCPLGFLQDLVSSLSAFIQKKVPGFKRAVNSLKKRGARLAVLDRWLRYIKYVVLVWAVGGSAYFGYMVFRDYDPWATLITLAEFSFTPGAAILLITLVASFFVERPWCRYACPLGAFNGLVGKLSPVYLKREDSACTNCKICSRACPMGLPVHTANTITSTDCNTCLECVGACPRNGALELKLGYNRK